MATAPRYLTNFDYLPQIQQVQLNQVSQNNPLRILQMERTAIEEAKSYLVQRFWMDQELTNTFGWDPTASYEPGDRVIIDYPVFSSSTSYPVNTCVIFNGSGYISNTNVIVTSPAAFNPADWTLIGAQYDFYNVFYPFPEFNVNAYYNVGDKVYWKGYVYTCTKQTVPLDTQSILQYFVYSNVPQLNVFPDDTNNNAEQQYWGSKTAYIINPYIASPSGHLPNNPTYWEIGDNRCQQLVTALVDLVLYYLHRTIAPDNIPTLRKESYRQAIKWLELVANGTVTPNLAVLQPSQGLKYRWGGNVKRLNGY